MTRKEFAYALCNQILNVPCPYLESYMQVYSDRLTNGTKVLRIKFHKNPTSMDITQMNKVLKEYLYKYSNIKEVIVRNPGETWSGLNFIIQIYYSSALPNIVSDMMRVKKKVEPEVQKESKSDGPGFVVTEFGIGYYSNKEDKAKMELWLEGVRAGMKLSSFF